MNLNTKVWTAPDGKPRMKLTVELTSTKDVSCLIDLLFADAPIVFGEPIPASSDEEGENDDSSD